MLGSLYDDPLTPKLAAIASPVLLLVGEQDPMGPKASATIADALVDGRLEVVPDCGHWIHVDEPEILVAAFERWAGEKSPA
jgi:pimeloyl-ACP methyl ester carboxylesterase